MWRVFNMGLGLVLAVAPSDAAAVRAALPEAIAIGEAVTQEGAARVVLE
jgi:phosphoribosylaminoimidazole (AIR) synthetase